MEQGWNGLDQLRVTVPPAPGCPLAAARGSRGMTSRARGTSTGSGDIAWAARGPCGATGRARSRGGAAREASTGMATSWPQPRRSRSPLGQRRRHRRSKARARSVHRLRRRRGHRRDGSRACAGAATSGGGHARPGGRSARRPATCACGWRAERLRPRSRNTRRSNLAPDHGHRSQSRRDSKDRSRRRTARARHHVGGRDPDPVVPEFS